MQKTQLIRGKYANDRAVRPWSASNPIEAASLRADGEPTVLCPGALIAVGAATLRTRAPAAPARFAPGALQARVLRVGRPSSPNALHNSALQAGGRSVAFAFALEHREGRQGIIAPFFVAMRRSEGISRGGRDGEGLFARGKGWDMLHNHPKSPARDCAVVHSRLSSSVSQAARERARLRKTNARGATSRAVKRKIKCSPIRPRGRVATAALDVRRQPSTPRRHPSTPGSRRRDVATELPGGVEERRDGSPPLEE